MGSLGTSLVSIDYWHRASGKAAKGFDDLAATFNKENEGKVKVTAILQGSIADLNKKVRAAAAGGALPGAIMADDYDVTEYAFSKILTPLDPYIADPKVGLTKDQIANYLPSQLYRHKLAIYGGKTMAFPQAFSAFTTFWNSDALKKAGFDGPPKTWTEFPDQVRAIAKANGGMAGWYISGAGDRFISTMLTDGVDWLAPDGKSSNFNNPRVLEIMKWWRQLSDEKLLAVPQQSASNLFVAGKCAYFMDSSGYAVSFRDQIKTFKWDGGMPPQASASASLVTETYGPVNALPKTNAEKQLAGWLWLKWLTSDEALTTWIPITNYFPSTKSAAASAGLKDWYAKNPIAAKLVKDVAPYARILSPSPALTVVREQITANVVQEVLLDRLSPENGVKKLKVEADKAIHDALQGS